MIGAPKGNRVKSFAGANQGAIAASGTSPEVIWHHAYDTELYTDNATTSLDFFASVKGDKSLSNMEAVGGFPAPQVFEIHNITADLWAVAAGVSTSATTVGNANDIYLLLMVGRPSWLFTLQNKTYGRYPLRDLHATGGPDTFISSTVATSTQQTGRNIASSGWNYSGGLVVAANTSFQFNVTWGAGAQDLTANWYVQIGMFGWLYRAVK